ncbi:MAG: hypothetical protein DHS20C10_11570 [marine bacterium B5-7]|nr:MAG: hypothetical protein DHS20C10_11570 [marine bacterium B5-7]
MKPLLSYLDHNKCYTYCNNAYSDYFVLPPNHLIGEPVERVLGKKNYSALVDYIPIVFDAGKEVTYRRTAYTLDDQEKRIQVTLTPHFNETGDFIGSSAYSLDVTHESNTASSIQLLTQSLPSVLAHELNQPLAIAQLYLQGCLAQLENKVQDKTAIKNAISKSLQQTERISQIINGMSQITEHSHLLLEKTSIVGLIEHALEQLAYSLSATNVRIVKTLKTPTETLNINQVLLTQALLNILYNALTILQKYKTKSPQIEIESHITEQQKTSIIIRNNGPRIPSDRAPLLFQLGCSGSPDGSGLGLWIANTILSLHQGKLALLSNEDGNVAFEMTI